MSSHRSNIVAFYGSDVNGECEGDGYAEEKETGRGDRSAAPCAEGWAGTIGNESDPGQEEEAREAQEGLGGGGLSCGLAPSPLPCFFVSIHSKELRGASSCKY